MAGSAHSRPSNLKGHLVMHIGCIGPRRVYAAADLRTFCFMQNGPDLYEFLFSDWLFLERQVVWRMLSRRLLSIVKSLLLCVCVFSLLTIFKCRFLISPFHKHISNGARALPDHKAAAVKKKSKDPDRHPVCSNIVH